VPNLVPSDAANVTDSAGSAHLAVIADLLADLPEDERRGVIANMASADRATVARMLVARLAGREGRPA
jgi:predicted DNA-binding ribbon-helix-helix protein